jgi:hypothetical protein
MHLRVLQSTTAGSAAPPMPWRNSSVHILGQSGNFKSRKTAWKRGSWRSGSKSGSVFR